MKFGSLFSGIGGIDLGLERAGMTCIWQSEIEPYACQVLAKHWPNIPNLGDIRDIDWTTVERADVVAGGYPCQPFSHAGRRAGEHDPRHLWPMFAECIRVVRPRYALLENVAGHLSLGFGSVLSDLAALGYDARWDCIPAAALGAPHLRDRVFVIATCQNMAHANKNSEPRLAEPRGKAKDRAEQRRTMAHTDNGRSCNPLRARWNAPWNGRSNVAHTDGKRLEGQRTEQQTARSVGASPNVADTGGERLEEATGCEQSTELNLRRGLARRGPTWTTEPNVGRVADGIPRRMDRLRGLGNAVVPQVAEHIGNIIMEADNDCQIEAP